MSNKKIPTPTHWEVTMKKDTAIKLFIELFKKFADCQSLPANSKMKSSISDKND